MTLQLITTNIVTVQSGHSTFQFSVRQENNRFKGTWYSVFVKQTTDMSDLGEDDFQATWKFSCVTSPTEEAAINYAGRKLIKGWDNKRTIRNRKV